MMIVQWAIILALLFPHFTLAALLTKRDGTTSQGKLERYDQGLFHFRLEDGTLLTLPLSEVSDIAFHKSTAAAPDNKITTDVSPQTPDSNINPMPGLSQESAGPYATPIATFETWKTAAIAGDLEGMVQAYAKFKQTAMKKDLKRISRSQRKKMQETTAQTQFSYTQPYYQGTNAVMEVLWKLGPHADSQSLQFILEGNDWKLMQ